MIKHLLVDFRELISLSIGYPKCSTQVLFDCNDKEAPISGDCPWCGEEHHASFRSTLQAYREVYRKLADPQGHHVEVRSAAGAQNKAVSDEGRLRHFTPMASH
jgi:hypothetical protein